MSDCIGRVSLRLHTIAQLGRGDRSVQRFGRGDAALGLILSAFGCSAERTCRSPRRARLHQRALDGGRRVLVPAGGWAGRGAPSSASRMVRAWCGSTWPRQVAQRARASRRVIAAAF